MPHLGVEEPDVSRGPGRVHEGRGNHPSREPQCAVAAPRGGKTPSQARESDDVRQKPVRRRLSGRRPVSTAEPAVPRPSWPGVRSDARRGKPARAKEGRREPRRRPAGPEEASMSPERPR